MIQPSSNVLQRIVFPQLKNVVKNFISLERETRKEEGGSGDGPQCTATYSSDFKEYAVIQNIPNFGIHGYFAVSKEPMNTWDGFDKAVIPKGVGIPENIQEDGQEVSCFVDPEKIQKPNKDADKSKVKFSKNDTSDSGREWSTATLKEDKKEDSRRGSKKWVDAMKEDEFGSEDDQSPRKARGSKDSPRSSRSLRSPRSSICAQKTAAPEDVYTDEEDERIPPSWGSNLIHVKDSPKQKHFKKSATTLELYASFVEETPNDEDWQTGFKSGSTLSARPSTHFSDARGPPIFESTRYPQDRGNIQDTSFGSGFMEDFSDVSLDDSDVDRYKTNDSPRRTPKYVSSPPRKTRSPAYHLPTKSDTIESIPPRPKSPAKSAKRPTPKETSKKDSPRKYDKKDSQRDVSPRRDPTKDGSTKKDSSPKRDSPPKREPPRKETPRREPRPESPKVSPKDSSRSPPKRSSPSKMSTPKREVQKSPRSPELSPVPAVCTPCSSKTDDTFGWLDQSRRTHKFRKEEALEPEHWEDYSWWTQDPDMMFQFQPPESNRQERQSRGPRKPLSLGQTPPVFSRDPEIRQRLVEDYVYDPSEFGLNEEDTWVEAQQYFERLPAEKTKPEDPRDYNRRSLCFPKSPKRSPVPSPKVSNDILSMSYMQSYNEMFPEDSNSPFGQRLNTTDQDIFYIHPPADFDVSFSDQAVAGSAPCYSESLFEYDPANKSMDFSGIQNVSWGTDDQIFQDDLFDESMPITDFETSGLSCDDSCQEGKGKKEDTPRKVSPKEKPAEKKSTPKISPEKRRGKKEDDKVVSPKRTPSKKKTTPSKPKPTMDKVQDDEPKTPEKKVCKAAWNYETPPELKKKTPKKKSPSPPKKTCPAKKPLGTPDSFEKAGSKYAQTLDDSPIEFPPSPKTPTPKRPKRSQQTSPPREDKTCSPCSSRDFYEGAGSKYAQTFLDESPMQIAPTRAPIPKRTPPQDKVDKSVQDFYQPAQTQMSDNLFDEDIEFAPSPQTPRRSPEEGKRFREVYFESGTISDDLFNAQPDFAPSPTTPSPGVRPRPTAPETPCWSPGNYFETTEYRDNIFDAQPNFAPSPQSPGSPIGYYSQQSPRPGARPEPSWSPGNYFETTEYRDNIFDTQPNFAPSPSSPRGYSPRKKSPGAGSGSCWSPGNYFETVGHTENFFDAQPNFAPSPNTPQSPRGASPKRSPFAQRGSQMSPCWSPGGFFESRGNSDNIFDAQPSFAPSPKTPSPPQRKPMPKTGEYTFVGDYSPGTTGDNIFDTQPNFAPSPTTPERSRPQESGEDSCNCRDQPYEQLPQLQQSGSNSLRSISVQPGTTNIPQSRDPYAIAFRQELELKDKQPYSPHKSMELQCGRRRVKVRKGLVRPDLMTITESEMEYQPMPSNYMDIPQGEPSPASPMVFRGSVVTPKRGMPPVYPNQPSPYEEMINEEDLARLEFRRYEYQGQKPVVEEPSSPKGAIRKGKKGRRLFAESPKVKRSPQKDSPKMVSPDIEVFEQQPVKEDLFDQDVPLGFDEDIYGSPIEMPDFDDILDQSCNNQSCQLDNMNDISLVQSPQLTASPGSPEADLWNMYGAVRRHERVPVQRRPLTRKPMIPRLEEVSEYPEEQYPFWDHRRLPRRADEKLTAERRREMDRALQGDMDWLRRQQAKEEAEKRKIFQEENRWLRGQERKQAEAEQERQKRVQEEQAARRAKLSPELLARIQKARQIQPVVIDSPCLPSPKVSEQSPSPVQWNYQTPPQYKSKSPPRTKTPSPQRQPSPQQRQPSPQYVSEDIFAPGSKHSEDIFSAPSPDLVSSPEYSSSPCSPRPQSPYGDPRYVQEQWDQYMSGEYDALDTETEPELVSSPTMDPLDRAWVQEVDLRRKHKMQEKEFWDLQVGGKRYKAMRKPSQQPDLQPIREVEPEKKKRFPRDSIMITKKHLSSLQRLNAQPPSPEYQRPDVDLPSPVRTEFIPPKPKERIPESPKGKIKPKPRRLFEDSDDYASYDSGDSKTTESPPKPMVSPKISPCGGVPKVYLRSPTTPESPKETGPVWEYETPPELKTKKEEKREAPVRKSPSKSSGRSTPSGRRTPEKGSRGKSPERTESKASKRSEGKTSGKRPKKKTPEKGKENKTPDKSDDKSACTCEVSPQYEREFEQMGKEGADQLLDETPYFLEEFMTPETPVRSPKRSPERKTPTQSGYQSPQYERDFNQMATRTDQLFDEAPYFLEEPPSPQSPCWGSAQNSYRSNIMEEQMPDWSDQSPRRLSDEEIWDMHRRVKEQQRQPIQRRTDVSMLVGKKRVPIVKAGKPKRPGLGDLPEEGEVKEEVNISCEQSCGAPSRPQMLVVSPDAPIQAQEYSLYNRPEYQWEYQTPPRFKQSPQRPSPPRSPVRFSPSPERSTPGRPSPEQSFERPDYFSQSPYREDLGQFSPPPDLYNSYESPSPSRSPPNQSYESQDIFEDQTNQYDMFEEQPQFAESPCSTSGGSPCSPGYRQSPRVVRTPKQLHPGYLVGQTPPSAKRTPTDDPRYVFPELVRFEQPRNVPQMNQTNYYSPYDQRMSPTPRYYKDYRRNLIEDFIIAEREDEEAMVERFNTLARAQGDRQSFLRGSSPPRMTVSPGQVEEYGEISYEPREFDFYRCPGDLEYDIRPAFEGQSGPGLFSPGYQDELTEEERNFKWMDKLQRRR